MRSCRMFTRFGFCPKYNLFNPRITSATGKDRCLVNPFLNKEYVIDRNDPIIKNFNIYGNNKAYDKLETDCCGNGCKHCSLMSGIGY